MVMPVLSLEGSQGLHPTSRLERLCGCLHQEVHQELHQQEYTPGSRPSRPPTRPPPLAHPLTSLHPLPSQILWMFMFTALTALPSSSPALPSQILWMFTALTATTAALSIVFTLADAPRQWAAGSDLLLCLSILVSKEGPMPVCPFPAHTYSTLSLSPHRPAYWSPWDS